MSNYSNIPLLYWTAELRAVCHQKEDRKTRNSECILIDYHVTKFSSSRHSREIMPEEVV